MYAAHAAGCRITDIEGVERIDFANNMASLIHGHSHPAIVAAVTEQLQRGTACTMATEIEVVYAEYLCSRSPSFDQLRFVNSGTEAVMGALKAARAFTGRPKIVKVEGTYHGVYDFAEVSQTASPATWGSVDSPTSVPVAKGTPQSVLDDVVVVPLNDVERTLEILRRHAGEVACVLLDVMPHRAGLIPADQEFVDALSAWAVHDGALVVCDEVITFREGFGGAQQRYGLLPDITAMGKIIGGGFPVGAIAGRRDVMGLMDPHGDTFRLPYSGTFSANPITMTAGMTAMTLFDHAEVERVNRLARMAVDGVNEAIQVSGHNASVTGSGSLFRIHMHADPPRNYRESYPTADQRKRLESFFNELLDRAILMIYSGMAVVSTAMGESEIEQFVAAVDEALAATR